MFKMVVSQFEVFPELSTSRLELRRMRKEDVPTIFALRSSPDVMRYIDRKKAETIEEAKAFLKIIDDSLATGDGLAWGVYEKGSDQLAGNISFWRILKEHSRAELGYMLMPDYWNKGLMKEAIRCVLEFGFNKMHLHSVEARINPLNVASSKVLLATGFRKEAYFREDFYFEGKFGDTEVYSRLSDD